MSGTKGFVVSSLRLAGGGPVLCGKCVTRRAIWAPVTKPPRITASKIVLFILCIYDSRAGGCRLEDALLTCLVNGISYLWTSKLVSSVNSDLDGIMMGKTCLVPGNRHRVQCCGWGASLTHGMIPAASFERAEIRRMGSLAMMADQPWMPCASLHEKRLKLFLIIE
jgi:hypothetical protein